MRPTQDNRKTNPKPIGAYLVESGLLTPAQVEVALKDQALTSLRLGDIVAARGWVKTQTIEYLMDKIVLPERHQLNHRDLSGGLSRQPPKSQPGVSPPRPPVPKTLPTRSKPQTDGGVTWIG